jgi:uncharacterized protein YndB with AHSA1/START domain
MNMKKLEYTIDINAKRDKVWKTMLEPDTYQEWVSVSWPNSRYDGKWKQGEDIKFLGGGENQGGTKANLVEVRQPEYLNANHIAIINGDGTEDSTSEIAKGWVGTTEEYFFTEKGDQTELRVVIHTNPDWESMFNDGWPNALKKLKEISERKAVTV